MDIHRFSSSATGIRLAVFLMAGIPLAAAPINVSATGTWQDPGGVVGFNGGGTNQIDWGIPASSNGQSGWRFDGAAALVDAITETAFQLGSFTHNNFPIFAANFVGASLDLTLTLDGVPFNLALAFTHLETPNNGSPCAAGGAQPCPDLVTLPSIDQVFTANGRDYHVVGFLDAFSAPVGSLVTLENQINTAALFAAIEDVTEEITATPEPGTVVMFGAALLAVGWRRRRC